MTKLTWIFLLCALTPPLVSAQSYNPYQRAAAPPATGYSPYSARIAGEKPALIEDPGVAPANSGTSAPSSVGNLYVPGASSDPWKNFDPAAFEKSAIKDILVRGAGELGSISNGSALAYYLNNKDLKGAQSLPNVLKGKIVTALCAGRDERSCTSGALGSSLGNGSGFLGGLLNFGSGSRFSADLLNGAWSNFVANLPLSTGNILSAIDGGLKAVASCTANTGCVDNAVRNLTASQMDVVSQFFNASESAANNSNGPDIVIVPVLSNTSGSGATNPGGNSTTADGRINIGGTSWVPVVDPATGAVTLKPDPYVNSN